MSSGQAYWQDKWELEYEQERQNKLKLEAENLQITVEMLLTLRELKAFWNSNKNSLPYGVVYQADKILNKIEVGI